MRGREVTLDTVLLALSGPAVALASFAYTVVTQRKKASADALAAISARVSAVETRTTQIEGQIENLPNREATHRLELALSDMRGDLKALTERIGPMAATSMRLQEYLLEQAK
ncbi:hypothetical protein CH338_15770 [Rhodoplanes elegans]|uniref:DUF2730 domain-containing protein n=1 Tax=Rhodoplanes elegans TaxID=29408 RepID=A0A327KHA2_9BRAD|nr:DUF2730 family protein [Rhodoplanes elegans]RAI37534.1 hypothetical protein CH338_15770 [Rhodoplanes elegans]